MLVEGRNLLQGGGVKRKHAIESILSHVLTSTETWFSPYPLLKIHLEPDRYHNQLGLAAASFAYLDYCGPLLTGPLPSLFIFNTAACEMLEHVIYDVFPSHSE